PSGITAGPDGNIWFTEAGGNRVARLNIATDEVLEFPPLPTPKASPGEITPGPDSNLWFTEQEPSKVASITPTGVVTEYSGLTPKSGPFGIATGPDGSVWFAEELGGRIGRVGTGVAGPLSAGPAVGGGGVL